jgi:uncharacterized protein (TIGR02145 family)
MKKLILFFGIAFLIFSTGYAQLSNVGNGDCVAEEIIIGTGTNETEQIPINTLYKHSYSQQIYDAAELGIDAGTLITGIAFEINNMGFPQFRHNQSIYLGHTTKPFFSAFDSDWIPVSELQLVYSGTVIFDVFPQETTIEFDTHFEYIGGNLVVTVVNNDGTDNMLGYLTFRYHDTSLHKTLHRFTDDGTIDPNFPGVGAVSTERNNIKLLICYIEAVTTTQVDFSCSGEITVTYDLNSPNPVDVMLYYSHNQCDWIVAQTVSGDLFDQTTGIDKTIVWNNYADNVRFGKFYFKVVVPQFICEGVKIKGICWAECNVDMPGTFTSQPSDAGMFYQWGSNVGWSSTDPLWESDGINTWRNLSEFGNVWLSEKNPCPNGWRVPTEIECFSLWNTNNYWGTLNGVNGRFFGDEEPYLFVPAAGSRIYDGSLHSVGTQGLFWSSNKISGDNAQRIIITSSYVNLDLAEIIWGHSVRCVKELSRKKTIIQLPETKNNIFSRNTMSRLGSNTQCPNFTDLFSPNVTAYTGNTSNPFLEVGVVDGRHTLITEQGTDPNTGGALNFLPPGESEVIKLGNEQVGAEAEVLSYRFTVDVDNTMLLLKFAVVLEDPGHLHIAQPRFVVRVTDSDGNLIEDCADYDVSAGKNIPGFQTYQINTNQTVRWRNWTNVGIDLLNYVGQEVLVQFITYDCTLSGHFGYAYFTASCMSNKLQLEDCLEDSFTLSAPENFESYLWSNGTIESTATFNTGDVNNSQIFCIITSATGCRFTLYAYVSIDPGGIETGDITDTICEGATYTLHHFNLPPQPAGQYFYQNVIINPADCEDVQTINLYLTVIRRYNQIAAAICHGENYTENGFFFTDPLPGVWHDTIHTGNIAGCDEFNVLKLTVSVSFDMPDIIIGDDSPCTQELVTYTFEGSETLTSFYWEFPNNVVVVSGKYTPQVTVYFTDDTPCEIVLNGANGCGSGSTSLTVHPRLTHVIQLNEHICQGNVFNLYNFNLGVQDNVGYFVYSKHLTSSLECDSIVTLVLNVLPTPEIRIEPTNPVICISGEEITLWALTDTIQYAEPDLCPGNNLFTYIFDCELSYLWNTGDTTGYITKNPTETTTYTVTVTLSSGCSASASQLVVVDTNEPVFIDEIICNGETYSAFGIIATETGIYETTFQTDDCEIAVTVDLTITEPSVFLISGDICAGERFTDYGFDFTLHQEGLFVDTVFFISSSGCDSLVIFNLFVFPPCNTLSAEFFVNDVHHSVLSETIFCENEVNFRAEVEGLHSDPESLEWYINNIKIELAIDQLQWNILYPNGEYEIKLWVRFENGMETTITNTLKIFKTWVKMRNIKR